jgi:Reverse transcriptase (RNA-dependent DNA polymerase)
MLCLMRHHSYLKTCTPSSSSIPVPTTTQYPLLILPPINDPLPSASDSTSVAIPSTLSYNPPTPNPIISLPPLPSVIKVYSRRSALTPQPIPISAAQPPSSSHSMITHAHARLIPNQPKALLAINYPVQHQYLDPTTYTQASKEVHWRATMAKELDALAQNNTWSLVPTSEAINVVGCKWVFKTKRSSDGMVERHKARLVAKGYTQEEGLDYTDTFSHVIKPTTIRLILSLAVTNN